MKILKNLPNNRLAALYFFLLLMGLAPLVFRVAEAAPPQDCLIRAGQACVEYAGLSHEQKISLAKSLDPQAIIYQNFVWYLYGGVKYSWNLETDKISVSQWKNVRRQILAKNIFIMEADGCEECGSIGKYDLIAATVTVDADGLIRMSRVATINLPIDRYFTVGNTLIYTDKKNAYRLRFPETIPDSASYYPEKIGAVAYFDIFKADLEKLENNPIIPSFVEDAAQIDCLSADNDKNKEALLCFAKKLQDCQPAKIALNSKLFSDATAKIAKADGRCFVELNFGGARAKKCLYDISSLSGKNDIELIKSVTGFADKFIIYNASGLGQINDKCIDNGLMLQVVSGWYKGGSFNCSRLGSAIDDYYRRGYTVGFGMMDSLDKYQDSCYGYNGSGGLVYADKGHMLHRVSCDQSKSKDKSSSSINIPCPFGCQDGACLKPSLTRTQKIAKLDEVFAGGIMPAKTLLGDQYVAYYSGEDVDDLSIRELYVYNLKNDGMSIVPLPASIEALAYLHIFEKKFYAVGRLAVKKGESPRVGIFEVSLNAKAPFKLLKTINGDINFDLQSLAGKNNLIFIASGEHLYSYDIKKNTAKALYSIKKDKKLDQSLYSHDSVSLELYDNTLFFGPDFNTGCGFAGGDIYYLYPLDSANYRPINDHYAETEIIGGISGKVWLSHLENIGSLDERSFTAAFDTVKGVFGKSIASAACNNDKVQETGIGYYQGKMVLAQFEYSGSGRQATECAYGDGFDKAVKKLYLWDGFSARKMIADGKTLPGDAIDFYYDSKAQTVNMLSPGKLYQYHLSDNRLIAIKLPFAIDSNRIDEMGYLDLSHDGFVMLKADPNRQDYQCYAIKDGKLDLLKFAPDDESAAWFNFGYCTWESDGGC